MATATHQQQQQLPQYVDRQAYARKRRHHRIVDLQKAPESLQYEMDGRQVSVKRERFLGKGSFASCFEYRDKATTDSYAFKIISKSIMKNEHQYDKVVQEVAIHTPLNHPNVVKLLEYFEDRDNLYIVLELCSERSMMELQKSRQIITEPEARYFLTQIVAGVSYIHSNRVIHRDLKLGNLLITNDMKIKIADFGLAIREGQLKERAREKAGTPNYIAPEVLLQVGHSYPVDVWAIGIVLYALLVGVPPFETNAIEETYRRIKENLYNFTPEVGQHARELIRKLLAADPNERPKIDEVLSFDFFKKGFCPRRLPISSMAASPRVSPAVSGGRIIDQQGDAQPAQSNRNASTLQEISNEFLGLQLNTPRPAPSGNTQTTTTSSVTFIIKATDVKEIAPNVALQKICKMLDFLDGRVKTNRMLGPEDEYPAGRPVYWVTRWLSLSSKYGVAYQLSNGSVGFLFRDDTKILVDSDGINIQYIDARGNEFYYTHNQYPAQMNKKILLLKAVLECMQAGCLKLAGSALQPTIQSTEASELERWPSVTRWLIDHGEESTAAFCTSDGAFQVNFKKPYVKIVISSTLAAVTFIFDDKYHTYRLDDLRTGGCPAELVHVLKYARAYVLKMMNKK